MYELGWTKLCWPDAPIAEGTVVGVLGRPLGVWSLNAWRIAYTIEEENPMLRRYGFAFGTLPEHVERGEERFTVEWHGDDDSVWYEEFAFACPAHPLAGVGRPFAQRRRSDTTAVPAAPRCLDSARFVSENGSAGGNRG